MSERAIVIGTSAGGVQALSRILPGLPAGLPMPVLVVVHVPPRKPNALVELFAKKCPLPVKEAEDKEPLANGIIYLAPPDYHLLVETESSLALSSDEVINHSRPAIDALFETAADAFGPGVTGIVLTGANHDGAAGLKAVGLAGGTAIVEDPASAEVPTMPAAALAACPTAKVMTLDQISNFLKETAAQ
ncbi:MULTISPECIES: chemotaxis protein CheB [Sphingobium]|jgi:two-component system chemotaxis response regulator CheB|uniref:chemotaxis protein CheB n=1 Tax=Sphingobium TaxID=165695 RepID=UPI00084643EB|nr:MULTISPECIES: chemotaxis protein CheB [Sphingobium]MDV3482476.1 chemotaxis protein CheB [Sphingobium yanoikuyae]PHP19492.1 chemotaxis protein CheB [Sphingobium sp. IP1]PZU63505.1 MAG: chemotaxis protein CheB [Sphingobium sp.]